jgi:hypothetical protein
MSAEIKKFPRAWPIRRDADAQPGAEPAVIIILPVVRIETYADLKPQGPGKGNAA